MSPGFCLELLSWVQLVTGTGTGCPQPWQVSQLTQVALTPSGCWAQSALASVAWATRPKRQWLALRPPLTWTVLSTANPPPPHTHTPSPYQWPPVVQVGLWIDGQLNKAFWNQSLNFEFVLPSLVPVGKRLAFLVRMHFEKTSSFKLYVLCSSKCSSLYHTWHHMHSELLPGSEMEDL